MTRAELLAELEYEARWNKRKGFLIIGELISAAIAEIKSLEKLVEELEEDELAGRECEFCGDPATKVEVVDFRMYVCDECSADLNPNVTRQQTGETE